MTLQTWLAAYGLPLLIGLVIGFVLAWLILARPARNKANQYQYDAQSLDLKLKDANKALADSRQQEQNLQAALGTAKNNLAQTSNQVTALQNDLTASREQEQNLQADLDATKADLAARDEELSGLKFQFATLRGAVAEAQDALTSQLEPLQARVETLSVENQNLKANLEGISADLAKARLDIETMTQTLANKDTALTEAYARAVRLQREVSEQQGQLVSSQAEATALKRNLASLSASNQDLLHRLQDARGEVANELAVLTSTMLRAKDEQLARANATIDVLNAQLNESKSARPGYS